MPDLRTTAVLEIEAFGTIGEFHLRDDLSDREEVDRQYVVSEAGQNLRYLGDIATDIAPDEIVAADFARREGYHLDGGSGSHSWTLSFNYPVDDPGLRWGDGSSNPNDPEDYTALDATGCHPLVAKQVLGHWVAQAQTDSRGQARLYWGEYSNDGVFDPIPVAIDSANLSKDESDPSAFEGTLEVTRTASIPSLEDAFDEVTGAVEDVVSSVSDAITDW